MQFVVMAYDGTDDGALERRMAVREEHIRRGEAYYRAGQWLYAAGILDDAGKMIGSMIVCEFTSREEMERLWLSQEPYIRGQVWQTITVHPAKSAPFCVR